MFVQSAGQSAQHYQIYICQNGYKQETPSPQANEIEKRYRWNPFLDRHELPIDSVCVSTEAGIAVVVTRTCIGIWDILTGKLKTKLAESVLGAIVTHALVTGYSLSDHLNICQNITKHLRLDFNANKFDSPFHCTRDCFKFMIGSNNVMYNGMDCTCISNVILTYLFCYISIGKILSWFDKE